MKNLKKIAGVVVVVLLLFAVYTIFEDPKPVINNVLSWIQNFFGVAAAKQFQLKAIFEMGGMLPPII